MTITLKIDNPNIEEQLKEFMKEQKEITLEAFNNFVNSFQKEGKLIYRKRDPRKYSSKIEYKDEENEDLSDVKPYAHIEDSGQYIHDLRRKKVR
jgi:hypothetical protein